MKKSRRRNTKRALLSVLCCMLSVVFVGLLAFVVLTNDLMGQLQRPSDTPTLSPSELEEILNGTGTGPTVEEEDVDMGDGPAELISSDGLINILLIGQDSRNQNERRNSDAMILCTINKKTKTLTMTSFMRDTYVKIPGYGKNKLNAAYAIGGMELLNACLEENFGIQVDGNVEVNFSGFMKLIDMVGGVTINLTKEEASYLNYRGNWNVTGNDGWQLTEGENLLTGSQALAYSRIRALGMDMERTARQRRVITALIDKAKGMNALELYALLKEGISLITTDMTDGEIWAYATDMVGILPELKLVNQRIPVEGSYTFGDVGRVGDCVLINFETNRKFLADTLKP